MLNDPDTDAAGYEGQSGIDCSGLIRTAVRGGTGKHLPPMSTQQMIGIGAENLGKEYFTTIPPDKLQPGDIVVCTPQGDPPYGHTRMYLGNGYWIEAPYSGSVVGTTNQKPEGEESGHHPPTPPVYLRIKH